MSTVQDALTALESLEQTVRAAAPETIDPAAIAERIREIRCALSPEEARWISIAEAKRLLGVQWERTIETWSRLGLLRSRMQPDGRLEVLLDDVLYRREENQGLLAIGGDDLTPEELRILTEERPGRNPWDRPSVKPAR